jgi:glycerol-1-phosphate dehydrogenase [NAD(P)+]
MMAPADWPESLHGEQIGVTTLTMARLQQAMLAEAPPRVRPTAVTEADVTAHFGAELGPQCWRAFAPKRLDDGAAASLNRRIEAAWDDIGKRLAAVTVPVATLLDLLQRVGAPTTPEDLHWPRAFYCDAVRHAREIRDRYSFLDLAGDSGRLDSLDFV